MGPDFTNEAREVIRSAETEARRLNHEYIGTEHLLLGLINEPSSAVGMALQGHGVDLQRVRTEVEKISGVGPCRPTFGTLPYSPRARIVFVYLTEMFQQRQIPLGPEHLLLALLNERQGVAAQVMDILGVQPARLLKIMSELLSPSDPLFRNTEGIASTEQEQEAFDTSTDDEEQPGERMELSVVSLVRMAVEDGFSMEQTTKLAQHWHQDYVSRYGHNWSDDWDEQIALSLQGENGPALQPGINEKWYPWWEKLIQQLGKDGVFQNPDSREKWRILEAE